MKIIIDFNEINTGEKLLNLLDEKLGLTQDMPSYGNNLNAFWDVFSFSNDKDYFELTNYKNIKNEKYKEFVNDFIDLLNSLKGYEDNGKKITPNPNFDYKIIS